jgi:hypothetical protein
MVTLKSVFVDVELSNSYFGFLRFSENLDPFDTPLSDLTNETEFKNSLQMVDSITPKVSDCILKNFNNVVGITFNMSYDCSISGRHIMSDTFDAPVYTKI